VDLSKKSFGGSFIKKEKDVVEESIIILKRDKIQV